MSNNNLIGKRVGWLDIGKGMCMLFVLMFHMEWKPELYQKIYSPIFLSFFFFASGYVFKVKGNFKDFFIHKAKGLLIPLFTLSSISIIMSSIISVGEHSLKEDFIGLFLQIRGHNDAMWFVASTFTAEIVFGLIIKKIKDEKVLIVITFLMAICSMYYTKLGFPPLPWHIQVIGIANFLLALGFLYKNKYEKLLEKYISIKGLIISFIFYSFILVFKFIILKDYKFICINEYDDNLIMWFLVTFLAMVFFIELFKFIDSNRFLQFVGRNTLVFFAFHKKFQRIFEVIVKKANISLTGGNSYWLVFACLAFQCIFLCLFSIIINKYFPFLLGKKVNKNRKN